MFQAQKQSFLAISAVTGCRRHEDNKPGIVGQIVGIRLACDSNPIDRRPVFGYLL